MSKRLQVLLDEKEPRNAIHVSVMRRRDVGRVMSFDAGFDAVPGMDRIG